MILSIIVMISLDYLLSCFLIFVGDIINGIKEEVEYMAQEEADGTNVWGEGKHLFVVEASFMRCIALE